MLFDKIKEREIQGKPQIKFEMANSININTKGVIKIICNFKTKYLYIIKPNPKKIDKKTGNSKAKKHILLLLHKLKKGYEPMISKLLKNLIHIKNH